MLRDDAMDGDRIKVDVVLDRATLGSDSIIGKYDEAFEDMEVALVR